MGRILPRPPPHCRRFGPAWQGPSIRSLSAGLRAGCCGPDTSAGKAAARRRIALTGIPAADILPRMRYMALAPILALAGCAADPRVSLFKPPMDEGAVARALAEGQCVPYARVPDPAESYLIRIPGRPLYVCRRPERVRLW